MPRMRIALCTAALVVVLTSGSADAATQSDREAALLEVVNRTRLANGLRPLQLDHALRLAARQHSRMMLRRNIFAHGALRARATAYGARGPTFGENLAWAVGSRAAPRAIIRMWLASSGHRANLLRPGWRRIGIGAPVGSFAGYRRATVVTADFAGR
jgi:uncharacterized protein YkwD